MHFRQERPRGGHPIPLPREPERVVLSELVLALHNLAPGIPALTDLRAALLRDQRS